MSVLDELQQKLQHQLECIYHDVELKLSTAQLAAQLIDIMRITEYSQLPEPFVNHWSEKDIIMITYGDSVIQQGERPLTTLAQFIDSYLSCINSVHILPFFPYSSDDGFSVIDYSSVNEALGSWADISAIASKRRLMSDLVINHCSSRSLWFDHFCKGEGVGHDYFFTADPDDDLSAVVRPRTSALLRPTETPNGTQHVWYV